MELLKLIGLFIKDESKFNNLISKYPKISPGDFHIVIKSIIQNILLHNFEICNTKIGEDLLCNGFANFMSNTQNKSVTNVLDYEKEDTDEVYGKIDEKIRLQLKYPILIKNLPLALKAGILLYGMPGTGKTFLVEKIATLNKLKLLKIRGPELLNKYVGASEDNIRQVFLSARACSPCILFFDEFDSFAPSRGFECTGVIDRVVNQLLTEIDGVNELEGVCIIATTCHPELIDPALLRAGRLGCHLKCTLPDFSKRLNILKYLIYSLDIAVNSTDIMKIAELTESFSSADLKALLTKCTHDMMVNPYSVKIYSDSSITFNNLIECLKTTSPSISVEERILYDIAYRKFENAEVIEKLCEIKNLFA